MDSGQWAQWGWGASQWPWDTAAAAAAATMAIGRHTAVESKCCYGTGNSSMTTTGHLLQEESIRDNFVLIYELLDEVMDFGYPQISEASSSGAGSLDERSGGRRAAGGWAPVLAMGIRGTLVCRCHMCRTHFHLSSLRSSPARRRPLFRRSAGEGPEGVHHAGRPQARDREAAASRHQHRLMAAGRHQVQEERGEGHWQPGHWQAMGGHDQQPCPGSVGCAAVHVTPNRAPPVCAWHLVRLLLWSLQVFLDVVEKLNCLVAANGTVLHSEILGSIQMKCRLTGMPELKLGLNDKALFEAQGAGASGGARGGAGTAAPKKAVELEVRPLARASSGAGTSLPATASPRSPTILHHHDAACVSACRTSSSTSACALRGLSPTAPSASSRRTASSSS